MSLKSADHKNELATLLSGPWGYQETSVALTSPASNPQPHPSIDKPRFLFKLGLGSYALRGPTPSLFSWCQSLPSGFLGWTSRSFLWLVLSSGWAQSQLIILPYLGPWPEPVITLLGCLGLHHICEGTPYTGLTLDSHLIPPMRQPHLLLLPDTYIPPIQ